ncbi:MAG: NUDIX domain-containing protein [Pseudomonadota bacterium]
MPYLFFPLMAAQPRLLSALGLDRAGAFDAHLPGYEEVQAGDRGLLAVAAAPEPARAKGKVIEIAARDWPRIVYFLEAAGCDFEAVEIEGRPTNLPLAKIPLPIDPDVWQARALGYWSEAVGEITECFGHQPAQWVARRLPVILARAASKSRAKSENRPARTQFRASDIEMDYFQRPYSEFFSVAEYRYRHPTYRGELSQPLDRAVFLSADAVTVLPYDPVRDCVLLVEQVRTGPLGRGDPVPWIIEPIAGRIEPGDTPEETAHKEAFEEAGLSLKSLHRIGGYYSSTGCLAEYLVSFVGIADLPDSILGVHGVPEEGEDIASYILPRAEFMARLEAGEMPDGPLILSAYWLELNRSKFQVG